LDLAFKQKNKNKQKDSANRLIGNKSALLFPYYS